MKPQPTKHQQSTQTNDLAWDRAVSDWQAQSAQAEETFTEFWQSFRRYAVTAATATLGRLGLSVELADDLVTASVVKALATYDSDKGHFRTYWNFALHSTAANWRKDTLDTVSLSDPLDSDDDGDTFADVLADDAEPLTALLVDDDRADVRRRLAEMAKMAGLSKRESGVWRRMLAGETIVDRASDNCRVRVWQKLRAVAGVSTHRVAYTAAAKRRQHILALRAQGLRWKAIALRMGVSVNAVQSAAKVR